MRVRDGRGVGRGRGGRGGGHEELQPSWPARFGPIGLPIDHVLHSPQLTTVDRQLAPPIGSSDHRMVHASITFRDPDA